MKATISIHGELVVSPETELESYALQKWSDDYVFNQQNIKSTLLIDCNLPSVPTDEVKE